MTGARDARMQSVVAASARLTPLRFVTCGQFSPPSCDPGHRSLLLGCLFRTRWGQCLMPCLRRAEGPYQSHVEPIGLVRLAAPVVVPQSQP